MKRFILKSLVFSLVFCSVVTCFTFAASTSKTIQVSYQDIKLNVDGVQVTPKDANGATVEPFIYNGTTYLPVRAVGSALGKQVSWDGKTKTVYIGNNLGQQTFLMDVCPPYETNAGVENENRSITMSGQTYGHGFSMWAPTGSYAYINLNGNYQTMEFDFGALDRYNNYEMSYEIYLDGRLVQTIKHDSEDRVKHYSVPLNNALQMKIIGAGSDSGYSNASCGFANITVQ